MREGMGGQNRAVVIHHAFASPPLTRALAARSRRRGFGKTSASRGVCHSRRRV